MQTHPLSSRQFARNVLAAKRAALRGPVFITEHGCPAFALLSMADYQRISGQHEQSLLSVMDNIAGGGQIDFEAPRLNLSLKDQPLAAR